MFTGPPKQGGKAILTSFQEAALAPPLHYTFAHFDPNPGTVFSLREGHLRPHHFRCSSSPHRRHSSGCCCCRYLGNHAAPSQAEVRNKISSGLGNVGSLCVCLRLGMLHGGKADFHPVPASALCPRGNPSHSKQGCGGGLVLQKGSKGQNPLCLPEGSSMTGHVLLTPAVNLNSHSSQTHSLLQKAKPFQCFMQLPNST